MDRAEIPEGVTEIGYCAFYECGSLRTVVIPESVTRIDEEAFRGCSSLEAIRLPAGIKTIGERAFFSCDSLTSAVFPAGVTGFRFVFPLWSDIFYLICYTPSVASLAASPVYLGGSLYDLDETKWMGAARGFLFARKQGIREIDRWKEDYLGFIRDNIGIFTKEAEKDRDNLLFLIREGLLGEADTKRFLEKYAGSEDTELAAALLQYQGEKFGAGGWSDFSL